ncbi:hypothetical protein B0H13DRAFT_1909377, partial [Mycena leptocephala]
MDQPRATSRSRLQRLSLVVVACCSTVLRQITDYDSTTTTRRGPHTARFTSPAYVKKYWPFCKVLAESGGCNQPSNTGATHSFQGVQDVQTCGGLQRNMFRFRIVMLGQRSVIGHLGHFTMLGSIPNIPLSLLRPECPMTAKDDHAIQPLLLCNRYRCALGIKSTLQALEGTMRELSINMRLEFEQWLEKEKVHLRTLLKEPLQETLEMEYYQKLVNLQDVEQRVAAILGVQAPFITEAHSSYVQAAQATRCIETQHRHAQELQVNTLTSFGLGWSPVGWRAMRGGSQPWL